MKFTGERFIPEKSSLKLHDDHMERYRFATDFVANKSVLDIACDTKSDFRRDQVCPVRY